MSKEFTLSHTQKSSLKFKIKKPKRKNYFEMTYKVFWSIVHKFLQHHLRLSLSFVCIYEEREKKNFVPSRRFLSISSYYIFFYFGICVIVFLKPDRGNKEEEKSPAEWRMVKGLNYGLKLEHQSSFILIKCKHHDMH